MDDWYGQIPEGSEFTISNQVLKGQEAIRVTYSYWGPDCMSSRSRNRLTEIHAKEGFDLPSVALSLIKRSELTGRSA